MTPCPCLRRLRVSRLNSEFRKMRTKILKLGNFERVQVSNAVDAAAISSHALQLWSAGGGRGAGVTRIHAADSVWERRAGKLQGRVVTAAPFKAKPCIQVS